MKNEAPIIGHVRQCEQLRQDIQKENVSHAYLLYGRRHLGKFTIGQWFIKQLLTHEQEGDEREQTLRLISKNVYPDLIILDQLWIDGSCTDWNVIAKKSNAPQQHRAKAKVKTNTIGIDDVRALQERLHETAQGNRTCCFIRSIERMQPTAANAMLKILEEPPPHVVFCFTTESLSSLPPTIVSRMRVIHFSPLPQKDLLPLLEGVPREDQALLLGIAQGTPGIILQSLENPERLRTYRQLHNDALRFLESPSLLERFQQLTNAIGDSAQTMPFLQHVFLHLQSKLHSESQEECTKGRASLQQLFPLLHTLQSNTNKPLLSALAALQCSPSNSMNS